MTTISDTATVDLLFPIEYDGIKHSSLTMTELTVEEVFELDKAAAANQRTSFEQDLHYFAKMVRKPPALLMQLKERDWKRLKNKYWETLGNAELEPENSA